MAIKIYNVVDLQNIENNLAGDYELANDIDASETRNWNGGLGFDPVGKAVNPFTGSFDGKGYTINNLYINRPDENGVGLFGDARDANIKNVKLSNANITGDECVGALAGFTRRVSITNCSMSGRGKG